MPILVKCPNSHKINVSEKYVGKKVKCPKCEAVFVVAAMATSPEVMPPKTVATPTSQPPAPFDPFTSELPEPTNDPFAGSYVDPFAAPLTYSSSPIEDPWATQAGYTTDYSGSGMHASPATNASARRNETTEAQPMIRIIMYVVAVCFGLFALTVIGFVAVALNGLSRPGRSAASVESNGDPAQPQFNAPALAAEPANNDTNNPKPDLEDMSDDEKKKVNVFGYDANQRTKLVRFLEKNNVNRLKGNVSAMMVAAKLMKAAKELEIQPDDNKVITFPEGTKFEEHFKEGTLMKVIDTKELPEVFAPLIKKYEKGEASPEEKELAFYVLAAFFLMELK